MIIQIIFLSFLFLPVLIFCLLLKLFMIRVYKQNISVIRLSLTSMVFSLMLVFSAVYYFFEIYRPNFDGGMFTGLAIMLFALAATVGLNLIFSVIILLLRNSWFRYVLVAD
jgi:hypothetical protein